MQEIILPARTAEDLQRVVPQPLRAHRWPVRIAAPHELKPRALAERQRRDRTGLEVSMLADACRVHRLAAFVAAAVEVDEARVEVPASRHDVRRERPAYALLD